MTRLLSLTALTIALAGAMAAAPVLTLDPVDGAVSGTPGSTVGWGFTLTNDSGFLIPSQVVFCEGAYNSGCTPTYGTFTDFAAVLQFNVVAPGGTLTQLFNSATQQGIGSFTINANAPVGVTDVGTIFVKYDAFSCDPTDILDCTKPTQTQFDQLLSAPASVSIVSADVPEPASAGMILLGMTLLVAGLRRR